MYAVVRTDKMYATDNRTGLVSVRYQPGGVKLSIENGSVVKLSGLESNGTKEVYVGETPTASDSLSDIVLVATPEVMYDETKIHLSDFCNEAGSICRGYRLHSKDVFSATKEAFVGEKPEVGKFVELTSDVKLNVVADKTGSTFVGEIVDINKVGSYTYYAVEVCTVGAQAEGDLASMQEELDKTNAQLEELLNKSSSTIANELFSKVANGETTISKVTITSENVVDDAFENYAMLNIIDLVNCKSLSSFGTFFGCRSLKALVIRKQDSILTLRNIDPWEADGGMLYDTPIGNNYNTDEGGRVYVPRALLDAYKTAVAWRDLSNKFRAIEDYTVDGTVTGELDETKI